MDLGSPGLAGGRGKMTIGQREKETQKRAIALLKSLGYGYLGNWIDREGNRNIEGELLRSNLQRRGYDDDLIGRALGAFEKAASDTTLKLFDRNRSVYDLLRYGLKVKLDVGENTRTVWLIDWKNPESNDFAVAEEVTVQARNPKAHEKRPDLVLYVNGIALGIIELKRSTVSVSHGIRQNFDSQKKEFIEPFFSTVQLVMAGNDTEGLRYAPIETKEKYFLTWKEDSKIENPLDRHLTQVCRKERLLEIIHDFTVFDRGIKKLCRPNQYFGVRAAQEYLHRREGGIIWHTQGSGKSLTMVWLAKWIRENLTDARLLVITDRTELDEQIERVFLGVNEGIYRTTSGADLIAKLNNTDPWLLCSLIHKFGGKEDDEAEADVEGFVEEIKRALPPGFKAKGNLVVFVDECHRTQSGDLHRAMKALLPNAVFIGFTGTPLLKKDKPKSIETFGRYIHTYKFDEAVRDKVVLDLRYEARDIDQKITSQHKIDEWFEVKTQGLTDLARAQLKQRWGTLQKITSSRSRLEMIVADIMMDMARKPRLMDGRGNAMLVSGSIYQACKFYEMFSQTDLAGKCAIVTSYKPNHSDIKGEDSGEGLTEKLRKYEIYRKMLADWFNEDPDKAEKRVEEFETNVKNLFVDEPGRMKLLIVVDKLLTGFDAPSATYLYIDKQMRDHGLFQAICRVNRLDGDDKDYGYVVDYQDLFKSLEGAVTDYTSGAFDAYDKEDVGGLLKDRLKEARESLEEAREAVRALCEPVEAPRDNTAYFHFFCARKSGDAEELKANEPKRLSLYTMTAALIRAYSNIANEMADAGFRPEEISGIKADVEHFTMVRDEVKINSGDYVDLKKHEPAMRHLIDTYIRAEESEKISAFDDLSLVELIVERGAAGVNALPKSIRENQGAAAETIENNVRRLITDEHPINPKYYDRMSQLLADLIDQRRKDALSYEEYLKKIVDLARKVKDPGTGQSYPKLIDTYAKRALFDNLDGNEKMVLELDRVIRENRQDDWRGNQFKLRKMRLGIAEILGDDDALVDRVLELVKNQNEY